MEDNKLPQHTTFSFRPLSEGFGLGALKPHVYPQNKPRTPSELKISQQMFPTGLSVQGASSFENPDPISTTEYQSSLVSHFPLPLPFRILAHSVDILICTLLFSSIFLFVNLIMEQRGLSDTLQFWGHAKKIAQILLMFYIFYAAYFLSFRFLRRRTPGFLLIKIPRGP
jgi:hypothetical protein